PPIRAVPPNGVRDLPEGQMSHAAGPSQDGWTIVAIHDSRESWERFRDNTLMPRLQAGIEGGFASPPQEMTFEAENHQTAYRRRLSVGPTPVISWRDSGRGSPSRPSRRYNRAAGREVPPSGRFHARNQELSWQPEYETRSPSIAPTASGGTISRRSRSGTRPTASSCASTAAGAGITPSTEKRDSPMTTVHSTPRSQSA